MSNVAQKDRLTTSERAVVENIRNHTIEVRSTPEIVHVIETLVGEQAYLLAIIDRLSPKPEHGLWGACDRCSKCGQCCPSWPDICPSCGAIMNGEK